MPKEKLVVAPNPVFFSGADCGLPKLKVEAGAALVSLGLLNEKVAAGFTSLSTGLLKEKVEAGLATAGFPKVKEGTSFGLSSLAPKLNKVVAGGFSSVFLLPKLKVKAAG